MGNDLGEEFSVYPADIAMQLMHTSFSRFTADDGTFIHDVERENTFLDSLLCMNYGDHPYELLSETQRNLVVRLNSGSFSRGGRIASVYLDDTRVVLALAEGIGGLHPAEALAGYQKLLCVDGTQVPYDDRQELIYKRFDNRLFRSFIGGFDSDQVKGPVLYRHDLGEDGLVDVLFATALSTGYQHQPHP